MTDLDPRRRLEAYPHRTDVETRFQDLDPLGQINNVAMGALFEAGRVRFNHDNGFAALRSPGDRWLIARLAIDYVAEAHFPAPLTIGNAIGRIGRTSWTILSAGVQGGRLVSLCEAVLVATDGTVPTPLTDPQRGLLSDWQLRA